MAANGEMSVDTEINIEVSGIGEVENALVMPECPSVLSLGRLCVEQTPFIGRQESDLQ